MAHIPVLLKEIVQYFNPRPGNKYIDATIGGGGHTKAILESGGIVLGFDRDPEVVAHLKKNFRIPVSENQLKLVIGDFAELKEVAVQNGFNEVFGILFDLGLSSDQLDDPERGFAFQKEGPLDMRFDRTQKLKAADIINFYPEKELIRIFQKLGEEYKFGKKIAKAILVTRKSRIFETTAELFELIKKTLPGRLRFQAGDTARRIFMSLRIAVNNELESLEKTLPQALELLLTHGKLAVISFHSLEDRIVKNFLSLNARDCICPPSFPVCRCGHKAKIRILTKKPVTATPEEIRINTRSHSAKLRVAEKL